MEKILIEILRQKFIVSNVILAFLDHLKPKIFFFQLTMMADIERPPFQNLWICPLLNPFSFSIWPSQD